MSEYCKDAWREKLASYPSLLTPAFIACSTNVGEGLVKLITCSDVPGHWVNVWKSGTFLLYSSKWLSEPKKHCQDYLMLSAQCCMHITTHFWDLRAPSNKDCFVVQYKSKPHTPALSPTHGERKEPGHKALTKTGYPRAPWSVLRMTC